jgi:hypothetical protein
MFRSAKDALAGKSARIYLNDLLARYGRLEDLRIDSKAGTMELTCLLHGEREQRHSDRRSVLVCPCCSEALKKPETDF